MHDWLLISIAVDWRAGNAIVELEDMQQSHKRILAEGVRTMLLPRLHEWGPSESVNQVHEIEALSNQLRRLRIQMQSGDTIEIVAETIVMPSM